MTSRWTGFQSPLGVSIEAFLAHKRALGYRFRVEAFTLRLLDRFLVEHGVTAVEDISSSLMDAFLASRPRRSAGSYNHLLRTVGRLFKWLIAHDYVSQSPVRATPRRSTHARIPFLFDPDTSRRLLDMAASLPDTRNTPLRGPTYRAIFALLYGLGLRVGEVARLRRSDVDLTRQLLVVRDTKFLKSRLVPFGPRMGQLIIDYLDLRAQRIGPLTDSTPVFSFRKAQPIHPGTISQVFQVCVDRLVLAIPDGTAAPTVHCLRHSFAVGTLLRWYRSGVDPSTRLLHLSTFLGHVNPRSTAVYLTITTELLTEANHRFERWASPLIPGVTR